MSLGEKIRFARKCSSLSQEQLAEKMCVSRSAIAKWETNKGMPDVENLKILSRLLHVSVDALLADSSESQYALVRQPCNLAAFGRGCPKVRKDRLIRQKFPDARICSLSGRPLLTSQEQTLDSRLGILTPVPFSTPEYMKSIRDTGKDFYLVERETEQLFVTVTEDFLEIQPLKEKITDKTFTLGNWTFIRSDALAPQEF